MKKILVFIHFLSETNFIVARYYSWDILNNAFRTFSNKYVIGSKCLIFTENNSNKVYALRWEETTTLVNEYKPIGTYEIKIRPISSI